LRRRASGLGTALRRGLARLAVDPAVLQRAADLVDLVRGAILGAHAVVGLEVAAPGARVDGRAGFAVTTLAGGCGCGCGCGEELESEECTGACGVREEIVG